MPAKRHTCEKSRACELHGNKIQVTMPCNSDGRVTKAVAKAVHGYLILEVKFDDVGEDQSIISWTFTRRYPIPEDDSKREVDIQYLEEVAGITHAVPLKDVLPIIKTDSGKGEEKKLNIHIRPK